MLTLAIEIVVKNEMAPCVVQVEVVCAHIAMRELLAKKIAFKVFHQKFHHSLIKSMSL